MNKLVKVWQIGRLSYRKSLELQKHLVRLHHENKELSNTLVCLEHPPVYTTGIRTGQYPEQVAKNLEQLGAEFYRTNRGGLITFHGPGQLVVYPILNLKDFKPSMRWYVCHIEKTVIRLCNKLGIEAGTSPNTGVWVKDNKICAIGVHGSRFVTSHGLALNCSTDLTWFEHIVPCGIEGKGVTSLSKELNRHVDVEEVVPLFLDSFSEIFGCHYVDFPKKECDNILADLIQ
ncbi:octanoyl-[acyl-carrier-protein]:protein N-octanoyltransferase LIPT2, mitochondrial [Tenebrio molitor]|jgi:lipoate-protein ligase B|uniref:octanoyl-[acyl-carrier-protein]:protein N-octanoyltransferase LIPT2, mitochondrial n=1 Tax=Tenebrio molitor TaxID=7067 RepID=UPI00362480EA